MPDADRVAALERKNDQLEAEIVRMQEIVQERSWSRHPENAMKQSIHLLRKEVASNTDLIKFYSK